ncbi:uncharacterized mitochondrial protein-like protein [Tanacetum coccineum]|uniref:Uncharacterized mitochondrial protein-like protein n=1 Tax=Tanacetum coccineum TaxID=301880 RepID=A0ABQ5DQG0_9ASTR
MEITTSNALVSCDGSGYDWSDQAKEGPANFALIAYSSTSSNSKFTREPIVINPVVKNNEAKASDAKPKPKVVVNAAKPKAVVNATRPKAVVIAVKGNNVNAVKASTCWVWKPKNKVLDHVSKHNSASITLKKFDYGNPQIDLQDQGVIDSGCSRHMTRNMSYLTDFKEIDGGYVAFGGNPKGGKITSRGTKACNDASKARIESVPGKDYILLPLWTADPPFSQISKNSPDAGFKPSSNDGKEVDEDLKKIYIELPDDPNMPHLEDIVYSDDDEDVGAEADMNNLDTFMPRGKIDKTLFIRRDKGDILLVQVYVDDIIFGSTKKSLCTEFEKMMQKKFQMSSMGELTFFLGLLIYGSARNSSGLFLSKQKLSMGKYQLQALVDGKGCGINKEMDDSLERAATTATSLDAEQNRGYINKTQSKATPNEPMMRYFLFGRNLEELHVTWAHLEKKQTRLRTYTNIDQEFLYNGWRRRHRYNVTPSPRRLRRRHTIPRRHFSGGVASFVMLLVMDVHVRL